MKDKEATAEAVLHLVQVAGKQLEVRLNPILRWHLSTFRFGNDIKVEIWADDIVAQSANDAKEDAKEES